MTELGQTNDDATELIDDLLAEHDALEELGSRLMRAVRADIPDPAAVAALRWTLCRAFLDHWAREDSLIYDRLLASGDAEATAAAWSFRKEFGALRERFRNYVTEWPVGRIAHDWHGFQEETEELARQIGGRRANEEATLYGHARRVLARRTP